MKSLLLRAKNIFLSPQREWQVIRDEAATRRDILFRYVAVLALIPPVAAVAERYTFGRGVVGNTVHSPLGYVLAANIVWYFVIMANMIITAAIISAFVAPKGTRWVSLPGLQLASYSFTPVFTVSILTIVPRMNWLLYPAILYSLYLLYSGIRSMTAAGQLQAAWKTAASSVAAAAIVGVLNGMEYMLESFVAAKVFF